MNYALYAILYIILFLFALLCILQIRKARRTQRFTREEITEQRLESNLLLVVARALTAGSLQEIIFWVLLVCDLLIFAWHLSVVYGS